jgi:hypothetical protein
MFYSFHNMIDPQLTELYIQLTKNKNINIFNITFLILFMKEMLFSLIIESN